MLTDGGIYVFHLQPSPGSPLCKLWRKISVGMKQKFGVDAAQLFSPHASVSGFFSLKSHHVSMSPFQCPGADVETFEEQEMLNGSAAHLELQQDLLASTLSSLGIDAKKGNNDFSSIQGPLLHKCEKPLHLLSVFSSSLSESDEISAISDDHQSVVKIISCDDGHVIMPLECQTLRDCFPRLGAALTVSGSRFGLRPQRFRQWKQFIMDSPRPSNPIENGEKATLIQLDYIHYNYSNRRPNSSESLASTATSLSLGQSANSEEPGSAVVDPFSDYTPSIFSPLAPRSPSSCDNITPTLYSQKPPPSDDRQAQNMISAFESSASPNTCFCGIDNQSIRPSVESAFSTEEPFGFKPLSHMSLASGRKCPSVRNQISDFHQSSVCKFKMSSYLLTLYFGHRSQSVSWMVLSGI